MSGAWWLLPDGRWDTPFGFWEVRNGTPARDKDRALWESAGSPAPQPMPVPDAPAPASISVSQFAREAYARGIVTKAQATAFLKSGTLPPPLASLVASLPEDQRTDAELLLIGMVSIERAHPMTAALAAVLGHDDAWMDQFFRDAAARG